MFMNLPKTVKVFLKTFKGSFHFTTSDDITCDIKYDVACYTGLVKKGSQFNGVKHENKIFDFQNWNCFRFTMSQLKV